MKKIDMRQSNHQGYNLDCHALAFAGTQAGLMACTLAPSARSEAHNHLEREIFLFTEGRARVTTPSGEVKVEPGEAVVFDHFESHVVINESSTDPVRFHAIYWQESTASSADLPSEAPTQLLVFSTPPTPNGDLHCGHLSGPYIAADTLVRAQRLRGGVAWHVTGRDDHQTYVDKMARIEGRTPGQVADNYADALQSTLDTYAIPRDGFIVPTRDGDYAAFVQSGIDRLIAGGWIERELGPAAFDAKGAYLHEAFISGTCPHCGESSDGNACEACGRPNMCTDLGQATAFGSDLPPVIGTSTRLTFRLSRLQAVLEETVKSSDMSARTMAMSLAILEDGLPDIPITHPSSWGLPVSGCGVTDQTLYVWFEMAFGYLWGASQLACAKGTDPWMRAASVYDGSVSIAHCYGFDNSWYHTLLFPAVYIALGLTPPKAHIVNELLDLDGAKFSTSRRHLIWGKDLREVLPLDLARFALLANRPEGLRSNFTLAQIESQLRALFDADLPAWFEAFDTQVTSLGCRVPEPGAWISEHQRYLARLRAQAAELRQAMAVQTASPRRIAQLLAEIAQDGARFQEAQKHLFIGVQKAASNYRRTAVALGAAGLRVLAVAAQVVTPKLGDDLVAWLCLQSTLVHGLEAALLPEGHTVLPGGKPVLYPCPDRLRDRVTRAVPAGKSTAPA
jgi:methionyl-tRNA synthetase